MQAVDENQASVKADDGSISSDAISSDKISPDTTSADTISPDMVKLQNTIAALRPHMSEPAARETEAVLTRMFERAKRWNMR